MKFFTTVWAAQLALTTALPTTSVEERGSRNLYTLKAVASGQPFDGQNLQLDTASLNSNGFGSLGLLTSGTAVQVYTDPGTAAGTFALKIAPPTADPINVVLSGFLAYFQGLGAVRSSQLSNFVVRQGQFTLNKVNGHTFLGYSTLPKSSFYAYTPNGGVSYNVAFYDASSGNPPPIPSGQALIPLKLELVKVKKPHKHEHEHENEHKYEHEHEHD